MPKLRKLLIIELTEMPKIRNRRRKKRVAIKHADFIDCIASLPIDTDDDDKIERAYTGLIGSDETFRRRTEWAHHVLYLLRLGFSPDQLKSLGSMRALHKIKDLCKDADKELALAKQKHIDTIAELIDEI